MTIETRTTIQLRDISEIEIECMGCHTKITWRPSLDQNFIPSSCGKCKEQFFVEKGQEHNDLLKLMSILNGYLYGTPGNFALRIAVQGLNSEKK